MLGLHSRGKRKEVHFPFPKSLHAMAQQYIWRGTTGNPQFTNYFGAIDVQITTSVSEKDDRDDTAAI